MEPGSRRHHHERSRSARGPPPLPLYGQQPRNPPTPRSRRNPSRPPAAEFAMEDDAISTLMDIDESPLNGAGFLDEDDGDLLVGPSRGGRGHAMDPRGPLPYTGFFNSFDAADFDDADLE